MATFLALNAGTALAAILISTATHPFASAAEVLFAAICAYAIIAYASVLLSGLAGHLTTAGAGCVVVVALVGAAWLSLRTRAVATSEARAPGSDAAPASTRIAWTAATLYSVLAAAVAGALWLGPHVLEATRLWIWDDYTYHMIYPALWLRDHAIAALPPARTFTMQAWYPLAASLLSAWFMLPFPDARSEALAWVSLTGPLYGGIFAAGVAALMHRLGCHPGAWAVAVVLFATSQRIDVMASSFSDADLAQAATLFAAFVFAVPRHDERRQSGRAGSDRSRADLEDERRAAARIDAWYAAALSGVAIGIKVNAAVPAAIVAVMALIRAASQKRRAAALLGTGAAFAVGWAAMGGYWYVRNFVHMGNPVYPAAFLFWSGTVFSETTLAEYARRYGLGRTVADALSVYTDWGRFHAAMAILGLACLAADLVRQRSARGRQDRRGVANATSRAFFAAGGLAIVAAALILLPYMPYSAGNAMTFRSGFVHWDSMRYVALVALIGWVALATSLDGGVARDGGYARVRALAATLVTVGCLLTSPDVRLRAPAVIVGLAVAAAVASGVVAHLPRSPWRTRVRGARLGAFAATAVVLFVAGIVFWRHDVKAMATSASISGERFFGRAADVLDAQPAGARVAVFGDQWVFLTLGARNHLEPVRVDGDGRVASSPIGGAMGPHELTVDGPTFVRHLEAAGVTLVVVAHLPHPGRSGEWPTQHAVLEASPHARLLARGEAVAVWALADGGRPGWSNLPPHARGAADPCRAQRCESSEGR